MTTEIGRVKCWISTEGLRQKEVLGRETGMVYVVKTTTATTTAVYILRQRAKDGAKTQVTPVSYTHLTLPTILLV